MNKFFAFAGMLCLSMGVLSSCKKNNSSSSPVAPSYYNSEAIIEKPGDTVSFSAIGSNWVTASEIGTTVQIVASDTVAGVVISRFTFIIYNFADTGTFSFDSSRLAASDYASYETTSPAYTQTIFASCTVSINKLSGNNVYGTFSGILTDGSVIKNGTFVALGTGF